LHAASWRSAYRGFVSDDYLDHRVYSERVNLWKQRFSERATNPFFVILAEQDRQLAGFAGVFPNESPIYGSYLDNLHVAPERTGQGIGRRLLKEVGRQLVDLGAAGGLYLWVIEKNSRARRFYAGAGAREIDCAEFCMPDGSRVPQVRCYWTDKSSLLADRTVSFLQ
jgi:GNAT superfamily N-acetyltransferase